MRYFLFFLFILGSNWGMGQTGFIKPYDFDRPGAIITDMLLVEDTVVVCGLVFPDEAPYIQGLFLAKLDTMGNILAFYDHFDSLGRDYVIGNYPSGLVRSTNNDGYVLAGGIFQSANGILMKLGNDGGLKWVKEYNDSNTHTDYFKAIRLVEGGYLIGGNKHLLNYSTTVFLKKIGETGESIWEKKFDVESDKQEVFHDLLIIEDNEYVVGGILAEMNGTPIQDINWTPRIFGVDSLGQEIWALEGEASLEEMNVIGLHKTDNEGWLYATQAGEFRFDGFLKKQPKIIIRNTDFEVLVDQPLDIQRGNVGHSFLDIIQLENGDYLGIGSVAVDVDTPVVAIGHLRTWLNRFNENGEVIWESKLLLFPDTLFATVQYLVSAAELPSGSIIAAGYYDALSDTKDWGILVKVNKHGCIDTVNCIPVVSTEEIPSPFEDEVVSQLTVFPNPVINKLYLSHPTIQEWDLIEIYDRSGQLLSTERTSGTADFSSLPAGFYFVRCRKDGVDWVQKVIKR